jgi:hypothetical protein
MFAIKKDKILIVYNSLINFLANPIQYSYIVLKFVALFSIITILYMSEVFFEKIFLTRPWKALFVTTDDSIKEWWFRWKIDRYVSIDLRIDSFCFHSYN